MWTATNHTSKLRRGRQNLHGIFAFPFYRIVFSCLKDITALEPLKCLLEAIALFFRFELFVVQNFRRTVTTPSAFHVSLSRT